MKKESLLPPGEGQEEGIYRQLFLIRSPLPNPLPEGEGVYEE